MFQRLRILLVISVAVAAGASVFLAAQEKGLRAAPRPEIKVDATPVAQVQGSGVASYADVIEPVRPAVVSVYSTKVVRERSNFANPLLRQFFPDQVREHREQGLGSGVLVTADGYILTNNHVVEGADVLNVQLSDEREFTATLVGADPKTDVAVIKIDEKGLPFVTLADSDKLRVGDVVFAIGNPLGVGQTVTMGIVSATGRKNLGLLDGVAGYENFIQTDASINQGNSGGALIDARGRLVGINTAILSTSRGSIGIGFAIPVNLASSVMESLVETGAVQRGYLGVAGDPLSPELAETLGMTADQKGVLVTTVEAGSPAEKAGLKREDVIVAIDDKAVDTLPDLRLVVSQRMPGSQAKVHVIRRGKDLAFDVALGRLPEAIASNLLLPGVTIGPLTDADRRDAGLDEGVGGVMIQDVPPESPYHGSLVPGMIIFEINRQAVTDVASAQQALVSGRNLFLVQYRGAPRYLVVRAE